LCPIRSQIQVFFIKYRIDINAIIKDTIAESDNAGNIENYKQYQVVNYNSMVLFAIDFSREETMIHERLDFLEDTTTLAQTKRTIT
jgi:hypothetical protein